MSGALPSTVTFDAATGVLSGTPTAGTGGTHALSFTAANGVGSDATQPFTLTVNEAPAVTEQPADATVCEGAPASFRATARGFSAPGVHWEVSSDGVGWADVPGETSSTLSFAATTADQHGRQYHAVFTNAVGTATSEGATLTVNTTPAVTRDPASVTVVHGQSVTFSAAADGRPAPRVQWQVNSSGTWDDIGGATSADYTFDAARAQNGNRYRAVFTSPTGCGSATTTEATLTVSQAQTTTTITGATPGPMSLVGVTVHVAFGVGVSAPGAGTPTGQVDVQSGGTTLGSALVAQGYCDLAGLTAGGYDFTVTYEGDANLLGSTSAGVAHLVDTAPIAVPGGPYSGAEGSAIAFDGSASSDPDAGDTIAIYTWTFGDGGTSADEKPSHTYAQDGTYTARLTVTDSHGAIHSAQATVTVSNVAPSVDAGADATINEGATFTRSGSFTDAGDDAWTATVDYGDASGTQHLDLSSNAFDLSHQYTDDGTYTITVKVNDDDTVGSDTVTVTVANVAPTVSIDDVLPGRPEGSVINLTSTVSDPGTADVLSYSWTVTKAGVPYASGSATGLSFTPNDNGTYLVELSVSDGDGGTGSDSETLAVSNVAPTATLGNSGPVNEGSPATVSFSGAADASSQDTAAGFHYAFACNGASLAAATYAGSGAATSCICTFGRGPSTRTVRARIIDKDGGYSELTSNVLLRNVSPVLSGQLDQSADEGTLTTFNLGRFADPGGGPWAVRVSWGDGATSSFSVAWPGALPAQAHTYDDDGDYAATVTVSDDGGASASASYRAVIRNVAPGVTIDAHVRPAGGGTQVGLWANVFDPSAADTTAGFYYQWSLMRDSVEVGSGSADSLGFTIPAGDGAVYLAEVQAQDKDGGICSTSWHMRAEVRTAVDARIQILWPHGGVPVSEATLANLSAWLLEPGTLHPAALTGEPIVYLWRSLNNGPAEIVATGVRRGNSSLFDFHNVDVSAVRDPKNKLCFTVSVAGVPTNSNVWVHAQDGRTYFPVQDVPRAAGYSGSPVDARIEILWPHGNAPVSRVTLANLTAMLFRPGTLESAAPEWSPTVRLWRALDNGVAEEVAVGEKRLVTANDLTYPVWDFNNVDVSAARDGTHKLIFTLTVDGAEACSNAWVHGVDARTIFPEWDVTQWKKETDGTGGSD